jgi:hypothetical protein
VRRLIEDGAPDGLPVIPPAGAVPPAGWPGSAR